MALSAVASLWGSFDTVRNLRAGRGAYADLVDYTGKWSRAELLQIQGVSRDESGALRFDARYFRHLPGSGGFLLGIWLDIASLVAAALAAEGDFFGWGDTPRWVLLALVGGYQAWTWLATLRKASQHQADLQH